MTRRFLSARSILHTETRNLSKSYQTYAFGMLYCEADLLRQDMAVAIYLRSLTGRVAVLQVTCSRCGKTGEIDVATQLARFGDDISLAELRRLAAPDCPRWREIDRREQCGVMFLGLQSYFRNN